MSTPDAKKADEPKDAGPAPADSELTEPGQSIRDWHATSVEATLDALDVDPTSGLSDAQASQRQTRFGPNRVSEARPVTFWRVAVDEITEPMILLLVAVAVLYSVWGTLQDTLAIVLVILAVVAVEVVTEFRAKTAIAALGQLTAPTAATLRDGLIRDVATDQLVPGDVVVLRAGDRVPADVRLIDSTGLRVDESTLTGESVPVDKQAAPTLPAQTPLAERRNLAHAATLITAGTGRGVVVAIGMSTQLGRITGLVREAKPPRTPLQQAMRELSGRLALLAVGFSVLIPVLGVIGGQPVRQMILTGLTLAFATIPEELPILITMVLGVGSWRLSRRHALIRRLQAAETLGQVSVIVTDKTGTLTENRMAVANLWTGAWRPLEADLRGADRRVLALAAQCHEGEVLRHDGALQISADPTDAAIIRAADQYGLLAESANWTPVHAYGVDGEHPLVSVLAQLADGRRRLISEGAPEVVLTRCTRVATDDTATALTPQRHTDVMAAAATMAAAGQRVLAVGVRDLPGQADSTDAGDVLRGDGRASADDPASSELTSRDEVERDLTLVGLVALSDPPRSEAADAVRAVQQAGIRVLMVTGDHPATATAIAEAVGLRHTEMLTGQQLAQLDDAELEEAIGTASTFARVTPRDKLRIVRALHGRGEIVAVTGDGINDAPALAEADIGVAMGDGTDVAKEAAGMVLADDNFATIAAAVGEGRHLFDNLRKGVRYYLACKVALIASSAAGVIAGFAVPFAPIQMVVMEAFMDVAASTTFVAEPAEADIMSRPPRDPRRRFLDRSLLNGLMAGALGLFAAVAGVYLWASVAGSPTDRAQTLAFVTWMIGYVALAWVMRSERTLVARVGMLRNHVLLLWSAANAAAIVITMTVPGVRHALKLVPLTGPEWALAIVVPLIAAAGVELWKAATRSRRSRPRPAVA